MNRRRVILALLAVLLVGGASVAYAVWSNTQTGPANSRVGLAGTYQVTAGPPPGAPGGPNPTEMIAGPGASGSGSIQIVTGPSSMHLTSWNATSAPAVVTPSAGQTCDPTNFVPNTTPQAVNVALPANSTTTVDLPNAIALAVAAPTGCAGANVSFTVSATVTQP